MILADELFLIDVCSRDRNMLLVELVFERMTGFGAGLWLATTNTEFTVHVVRLASFPAIETKQVPTIVNDKGRKREVNQARGAGEGRRPIGVLSVLDGEGEHHCYNVLSE